MQRRRGVKSYLLVLLIILSSQVNTLVSASESRSIETWSGTIILANDHTIGANDELIVSVFGARLINLGNYL